MLPHPGPGTSRMSRTGPSNRGFTLVEVLVALGLMALTMIAIAPLFAHSLQTNGAGQDFLELNMLAKQQLEQVLQYNFIDARLAVPSGALVTLNNSVGTPTAVSGQLYRNETFPCQVFATSQYTAGPCVTGTSIKFPYELVYVVQDFNLDAFGLPDFTTPVDDANATFVAKTGVKMITVFAAAQRYTFQGTSYNLGSSTPTATSLLLSSSSTGKQIRLSGIKAP